MVCSAFEVMDEDPGLGGRSCEHLVAGPCHSPGGQADSLGEENGLKYLGQPQSGSQAEVTASRNPYGQYFRARTGRGGVPYLSIGLADAAWQALTAAQQAEWGVWAETVPVVDSLGRVQILSGVNAFVRSWQRARRFLGVDPGLTDPIWVTERPVALDVVITSVAGSVVSFDVVVGGAGSGYVQTRGTFPWCSTGTNSPPGRGAAWRMIGGGSVVPGVVPVVQAWPPPPAARRVFVAACCYGSDWVAGPWVGSAPAVIT